MTTRHIAHFAALACARSTVPLNHCLIRLSCGPNIGIATGQGSFAVAKVRVSPLDPVLNGIVVDARIAPFPTGEREWARQPVEALLRLAIRQTATLLLLDRGYPSLSLLFCRISHRIRPVMRVPVSFSPQIIGSSRPETKSAATRRNS